MGACFEAYREMGCGFLEAVYQECLAMEFAAREIPFVSQLELGLSYKGRALKQTYIPDFLCFAKIIVELKALADISDVHRAQIQNDLKATGHRLGLLINFGHHPHLQWERVVR